jgi:UPF0755 protein
LLKCQEVSAKANHVLARSKQESAWPDPSFIWRVFLCALIGYNELIIIIITAVKSIFKKISPILLLLIILGTATFSLPLILSLTIQNQEHQSASVKLDPFPVTVDPKNKTIAENEAVNNFLESANSPLQAAAGNSFWNTFEWLATTIARAPWYQNLAAVNGRFVTITPGMRKEQVANAFSDALSWNSQEKKEFISARNGESLPLTEGSFSPGVYFVGLGTTPDIAQDLVNNRFSKEILSRYGTSTAEIVPLDEALIIASLIQRETGGNDDIRLISGIIWNRIFANMRLQLDATLQYAKANNAKTGSWWPTVVPADKFRKSLYNTYMHLGLPPTPIANPSVAAVIAALNPTKTSCLFYFHDKDGGFHCSDTYAEHVKLLKKYYGQGK